MVATPAGKRRHANARWDAEFRYRGPSISSSTAAGAPALCTPLPPPGRSAVRLRHDVHCEPLHTRLFPSAVRWGGAEAARSLWKPKSVGLFEGECRNMRVLLSGILLTAARLSPRTPAWWRKTLPGSATTCA